MIATGWWLDPEVWFASQIAMWSLILINSRTRHNNKGKR